jgi:hypothetical protein
MPTFCQDVRAKRHCPLEVQWERMPHKSMKDIVPLPAEPVFGAGRVDIPKDTSKLVIREPHNGGKDKSDGHENHPSSLSADADSAYFSEAFSE